MAWDHSAVFRDYLADLVRGDPALRGSWAAAATRMRVAVYNEVPTPDRTAAKDLARYDQGEWASPGREKYTGGTTSAHPQGGVASGFAAAAAGVRYRLISAAPLMIGPPYAPVTPGLAAGVLVYDRGTAAFAGVAFSYFGGGVDIGGGGSLTLTWPAEGVIDMNFGSRPAVPPEPLRIDDIVPGSGPAGTRITISGWTPVPRAVTVGGTPGTALSLAADGSTVTATVPAGPPGPADVEVTAAGGAVTRPGGFTYV